MTTQDFLNRIKAEPGVPGVTLILIAEIERLQAKADALYKAARPIADKMAEDEAMGAEFDRDGFIEVSIHKAEFEKFIMVVYDWMREG